MEKLNSQSALVVSVLKNTDAECALSRALTRVQWLAKHAGFSEMGSAPEPSDDPRVSSKPLSEWDAEYTIVMVMTAFMKRTLYRGKDREVVPADDLLREHLSGMQSFAELEDEFRAVHKIMEFCSPILDHPLVQEFEESLMDIYKKRWEAEQRGGLEGQVHLPTYLVKPFTEDEFFSWMKKRGVPETDD